MPASDPQPAPTPPTAPAAAPVVWSHPADAPARLVTPRMVIRNYEPGDAPALFEAVNTSRSTLLPWLPWARGEHLTEAMSLYTVEWFRRSLRDIAFSGMIGYGVFLRRGGQLVGGTGFHSVHLKHAQCEVGYWLHAHHRGKGYCTESTRWIISCLLTPQSGHVAGADGEATRGWGFRRVEIFCNAQNAPSAAVPRRLGLPLECVRRADRWWPEVGWVDSLGWAVLADEWDTAQHAMKPGVTRGPLAAQIPT